MLKTNFISVVFLLLQLSFFAQETPLPPSRIMVIGEEKTDVITDTNGISVKAQVIEITLDVIKYKKADNLEGPTYTVPKSSIQKISFKNGSEEVFVKTTTPKTQSKTAEEYVQPQPVLPSTINTNTTVITNSKTNTTLNNSSNSCLQGEQDANLYHNRAGGNFLLGLGFGIFGVGFVALGDVKSPSLVYVSPEKMNDPTYMTCYKKEAKAKNITYSALGALASGILAVIIYAGN